MPRDGSQLARYGRSDVFVLTHLRRAL